MGPLQVYIPPFASTKEGPIELDALGLAEPDSVFRMAYAQVADYLDGGH